MPQTRILLACTLLLLSAMVRAQEKNTTMKVDSVEALRPSRASIEAAGFRNPFRMEHHNSNARYGGGASADTYSKASGSSDYEEDDRQYEDYDPTGYQVLGGTVHGTVTAGVNVGFGSNNPWSGATFFTGVGGTWLKALSPRWTVGVGLDFMHYGGAMGNFNTLSFYGMANYRFSDRVDLTAYVGHNCGVLGADGRTASVPYMGYYPLSPCSAYPIGGYNPMCPSTTVGADLGIKLGSNSAISIGVSFTKEHETRPPFMNGNMPQRNTTSSNEDVVRYHNR